VNFDAETQKEMLTDSDYEKVYQFGTHWSETFQASAIGNTQSIIERAAQIRILLNRFGNRLSANLVVGNGGYGFKPDFNALHELTLKLTGFSGKRLKLGVEGRKNGKRAIELASKSDSTAYVLHTPSVHDLLEYAQNNKVKTTVYTLCRFSEISRSNAASELMRIKGTSYFERRGLSSHEISLKLGEFAVFGTTAEVALQLRTLIDKRKANNVALYPVFENQRDLIKQMRMLSEILS
jgi:hypothetical protein